MDLIQTAIEWLGVVPAILGFGIAVVYMGRSKWAMLLIAGFGVDTLVSIYYPIAIMLLQRGSDSSHSLIQASFALAGLVGLAARLAIVGGVAGLLADNARQSGEPARTARPSVGE